MSLFKGCGELSRIKTLVQIEREAANQVFSLLNLPLAMVCAILIPCYVGTWTRIVCSTLTAGEIAVAKVRKENVCGHEFKHSSSL